MAGNGRDIDFALPVAVVGVDFRRAPARQRDRLLMTAEERLTLANELRRSEVADGLACLDTCNRTEWIVSAEDPKWAAEVLRSQMLSRDKAGAEIEGKATAHPGGDSEAPKASNLVPYVWIGAEAAQHLFEVAAGLESFVLGEKEIAAQLHRTFERGRDEQTGSPVLNGVSMSVGHLTRHTHRVDLTGKGPRGVHDLAVHYLLTRFRKPPQVVVAGLGQIGQKVVRSLRGSGLNPILCNRTRALGWTGDETVHGIDELGTLLSEADAVVVCTAAPQPIIGAAELAGRQDQEPLLAIDLSIPAQVAPGLDAAFIEARDLEDLQQHSGPTAGASWSDIARVRNRVFGAVSEFDRFCRQRRFTRLLQSTQERHQRYVREEIPALLDRHADELARGERARLEKELKALIRRYTNAVFADIREQLEGEEAP